VKLEQASKVVMWTPTRPDNGEGSTDREETRAGTRNSPTNEHLIRSHRFQRWRNGGWRQLPETKLYGEYGLVNLVQLIPSIASRKRESS
jgi:hypothetical protein